MNNFKLRIMGYMSDFEVGKCIELGRKFPNHSIEGVIKCIRADYKINKKIKIINDIDNLEMMIRIVCNYFQEKKEDLLTKSRRGELVRIRQICSLIGYIDYGYSLQKIGRYLCRSHCSIFHLKKRACYFYDNEKQFKIDVNNCKDLILLENVED